MTFKRRMMTPGPTDLPPSVLAAGALAPLHHRTPEFRRILAESRLGLAEIHRTKHEVFLMAGSGTTAMEAAVSNLLSPGDTMLVASNGVFGERWRDIGEAYGMTVIHEAAPYGRPVEPEAIQRALASHPEIRGVYTTLSETSTGVDADIRAIGAIVARTDAVLVVDAVSGLAAAEFETDAWDVDVAVSGSQKGLMMPPGIGFIALSDKAWRLCEAARSPRMLLDLRRFRRALTAESLPDTPWTPPITLVFQLREACRLVLEEGMAARWERHRRLSAACRAGLAAIGLSPLAESNPSVVVTAFRVPEGVAADAWARKLREEYGCSFGPGQASLKGKVLRFGHVGWVDRLDIVTGLAALEMSLAELGRAGKPGAAVAAAEPLLTNVAVRR